MSVRLRWRAEHPGIGPGLRLDLRGLLPQKLAPMAAAEIERLPLAHGRAWVPLAEFFDVLVLADQAADTLRLEGDLSRCDSVGQGLEGGRIEVDGSVGDLAGAGLRAGTLTVRGSAGLLAACEMQGGHLEVQGNVGDFAAGAQAGSMDGMRGGTLVVRGHAGQRLGDRMRRGTVVVFGEVGDFLASRMVAGTVAVGGRAGAHVGHAMRRGSLVFAGPAPTISPTFVPAGAEAPVFWQLLARDLARHGGPFADLAGPAQRWLGDLAAGGKGELIFINSRR